MNTPTTTDAQFDTKKFGGLLYQVGVLVAAAAVLWFLIFYGDVYSVMGGSFGTFAPCLLFTTGACFITETAATAAGYLAYEPFVFWIGLIILGLGLGIENSSKPTDARKTPS